MGIVNYLADRKAVPDAIGDGLDGILTAIVPLRRAAMDLQDACLTAQAGTDRAGLEETAQTLGALVRELSALLDQTKKCQAIREQLANVEARLA